jgi:uncharacterized FlgJ-related protein
MLMKFSKREAKRQELQHFAVQFNKYVEIAEEHAAFMRPYPEQMLAAHARVTEELLKEQSGILPNHLRTPEQIQIDLNTLAKRCEVKPASFDEYALSWIAGSCT